MNPLEALSNIIKVRDELHETQKKLEHLQRELDVSTHEIIEFLKWKKLIEVKK